jgi:hypothetical protein
MHNRINYTALSGGSLLIQIQPVHSSNDAGFIGKPGHRHKWMDILFSGLCLNAPGVFQPMHCDNTNLKSVKPQSYRDDSSPAFNNRYPVSIIVSENSTKCSVPPALLSQAIHNLPEAYLYMC